MAIFIRPLDSVLEMLFTILLELISRLVYDWTEISDYIETFVASKFTFLNEEGHDSLLFDDDTFSRSRQYAWVITSIGEFIPIIQDTKRCYFSAINSVYERSGPGELRDRYWGKLVRYRYQLEDIEERLNSQEARAKALRDGVSLLSDREVGYKLMILKLFNANAVVESRLSTRLAQNVKLLTYVSIFYLPLAFCAVSSPLYLLSFPRHTDEYKALWAIPNITDTSTRTPFIIAAVLIAFVTYMIVFNLNALVAFGWTTYDGIRKKCIQKMNGYPPKTNWKNLGHRFKRFEPDRGSDKPSEWYILKYCISHPFQLLEGSSASPSALMRSAQKDTKVTMFRRWKELFQILRSKSKEEDRKGKSREEAASGISPPEPV